MTDLLDDLDAVWDDLEALDGYSLSRIQLVNWGTFDGEHIIDIDPGGQVFAGESGTGKSTLLDAWQSAILPPGRLQLNAAAGANQKRRDDQRSILGYIRGEVGEIGDDDGGEKLLELRGGAAWSAISLEFTHQSKPAATLVRLFRVSESASAYSDINQVFGIVPGSFRLLDVQPAVLGGTGVIHLQSLRDAWPEGFFGREYSPYSEKFCRQFGIRSPQALRLLSMTQSMKDVGSMDELIRNHMLDEPATFRKADAAVAGFEDIDTARALAVRAADKMALLSPLREHQTTGAAAVEQLNALNADRDAVDRIYTERQLEQARKGVVKAERKVAREREDADAADRVTKLARDREDNARDRYLNGGGVEEAALVKQELLAVHVLATNERDSAAFHAAAARVGIPHARSERELDSVQHSANIALGLLAGEEDEARVGARTAGAEVVATESQLGQLHTQISHLTETGLSVDERDDRLRRTIAAHLGLASTELPFIAELIDLAEEHVNWRGAIEKLFHATARTIIVPAARYSDVARYVNTTDTRTLIRFQPSDAYPGRNDTPTPGSILEKLRYADNPHSGMVRRRLVAMHDYTAVTDITGAASPAITVTGLTKTRDRHHQKDDRPGSNSPRDWVIGFSNEARLAALRTELQTAAARLTGLLSARTAAEAAVTDLGFRRIDLESVITTDWESIDTSGARAAVLRLREQLALIRDGDATLADLKAQWEDTKMKTETAETEANARRDARSRAEVTYESAMTNATAHETDLAGMPDAAADVAARVGARFDAARDAGTPFQIVAQVRNTLKAEAEIHTEAINRARNKTTSITSRYVATYNVDDPDLVADQSPVSEYLAILGRLEADDFPRYRDRFRELMHGGPAQELSALTSLLENERNAIGAILDPINAVLLTVDFNRNSYLQIRSRLIVPPVAAKLMRQLNMYQSARLNQPDDLDAQYALLKQIISDLIPTAANTETRKLMLDVRTHVEFYGESSVEGGTPLRHTSASKGSGGERVKLEAFILAAALKYQMGGDGRRPSFRTVVMDEAYSKADVTFTEMALAVFEAFGFQLVVATPNQKVNTFAAHIGGVTLITKTAENQSTAHPIVRQPR